MEFGWHPLASLFAPYSFPGREEGCRASTPIAFRSFFLLRIRQNLSREARGKTQQILKAVGSVGVDSSLTNFYKPERLATRGHQPSQVALIRKGYQLAPGTWCNHVVKGTKTPGTCGPPGRAAHPRPPDTLGAGG